MWCFLFFILLLLNTRFWLSDSSVVEKDNSVMAFEIYVSTFLELTAFRAWGLNYYRITNVTNCAADNDAGICSVENNDGSLCPDGVWAQGVLHAPFSVSWAEELSVFAT